MLYFVANCRLFQQSARRVLVFHMKTNARRGLYWNKRQFARNV